MDFFLPVKKTDDRSIAPLIFTKKFDLQKVGKFDTSFVSPFFHPGPTFHRSQRILPPPHFLHSTPPLRRRHWRRRDVSPPGRPAVGPTDSRARGILLPPPLSHPTHTLYPWLLPPLPLTPRGPPARAPQQRVPPPPRGHGTPSLCSSLRKHSVRPFPGHQQGFGPIAFPVSEAP